MREEQDAGRRHQFLKVAWPGLVSWAILFASVALIDLEDRGSWMLTQILACVVFTSVWGVSWAIVAIKRGDVATWLGVLVTLSYPVILIFFTRIDPQGPPPPGW